MPNTGAWKQFERKVAGLFGTRRTPLSGRMSGHNTSSDSLHHHIYIEAKWLKGERSMGSAVLNLWDSIVKAAKRENKIPLLAMHRRGSTVEFGAMPLHLAASALTLFLDVPKYRGGCCGCGNPDPHAPHVVRATYDLLECGGHVS